MIFPADAVPERVAEAQTHTEGPAVGPDGRIYFCDITMTRFSGMEAGTIYAFDPGTGSTRVVRSPSGMAAGLKFDGDGNMLAALGADFGGRAVIRTERATERSFVIAGLYKGRRLNSPNDLDVADDGRIYFTDPRYFGHEPVEQPTFGVYRIDTDGSVHLIAADVGKPNGVAVTEDGTGLFVADCDNGSIDRFELEVPNRYGRMAVVRYDLGPDGTLSNYRVFVDYGREEGADGIAVDCEGNLYAAVRAASRPGVRVYDKAGRQIDELLTPEKPTNLALVERGGATTLYVTAGRYLYRIPARHGPRRRSLNW